MADQNEPKNNQEASGLVKAAKAVGSATGKAVAAVKGGEPAPAPAKKQNENLFQAEYLGSGTFIIHKPKRRKMKLRQTRLKGTVPGART